MQTLKKSVAALAVMAAASATFAVSYSGDLQLQLGWQGASTTVSTSKITGNIMGLGKQNLLFLTGSGDIDTEFPTNSLYMAISNYNLFNLNNLFSVGFFDKLDMSIGAGNKMNVSGGNIAISAAMGGISKDIRRFGLNFIIGPAAAIRIADIIKLQLGVGFVGGVEITRRARDDISDGTGTGVIGGAVDIQSKFLPNAIVSPFIGFQYAYRSAGLFEFHYGTAAFNNMLVTDLTAEGSFGAHSYAVYAGASWNFGDR